MKFFDLEMNSDLARLIKKSDGRAVSWVGDNGHGGCTHLKFTHGMDNEGCLKEEWKSNSIVCTTPFVEPIK